MEQILEHPGEKGCRLVAFLDNVSATSDMVRRGRRFESVRGSAKVPQSGTLPLAKVAAAGAYRWGEPDKRRELEGVLAALGGIASSHVLVYLPPLKMAEKPADVRVETTDKAIVRLDEWDRSHSGRVAALNEAHRRLWRVAVYTHPSVSDEDRRLVRLAAEHELGVRSRYVDETDDRYLEAVFDRLAEEEKFTAGAQTEDS
jgi:hypothetical protein